jgi:putative transposase
MPRRKRHSHAEIAAKLAQAEQLIAQGRRQQEVARSLGVSVMTFHRWRKAQPARHATAGGEAAATAQRIEELSEPERLSRIAELQLENKRLRQLVTDLLLEKVQLEEASPRRGQRSSS